MLDAESATGSVCPGRTGKPLASVTGTPSEFSRIYTVADVDVFAMRKVLHAALTVCAFVDADIFFEELIISAIVLSFLKRKTCDGFNRRPFVILGFTQDSRI